MNYNDIIGALIGIVRSTDNAPTTQNTFFIIIEGLQLNTADETLLEAFYQKAMDEKFRLVPDCAVCKKPCGRTFNYNMKELEEEADEELKKAKYIMLEELIQVSQKVTVYSKELENYFYDGLFGIGDYYDSSQFDEIFKRKEALGL